jgi:hypothetical protein
VDYLHALSYSAHRESPDQLRRALASIDEAVRQETSAGLRRRLLRKAYLVRRRLTMAEMMAAYDWSRAESEFVEWVCKAIDQPGVFERWRAHGVPLRVLLDARRRSESLKPNQR